MRRKSKRSKMRIFESVGARDMSIHDDASNSSNVVMYGEYWYPFDPVSALTVIGPIFRSHGINFMNCTSCDGALDTGDVAHDDFGELRCAWCGSNQLEFFI